MISLKDCPPVTFVKRRNQRSLRIRVKADAIVVSAPLRCTEQQMASFLIEREAWVRQTARRLSGLRTQREDRLRQYRGHTLLHGSWTPMVYRHPRPGSDEWLLVWRTGRVDVYPPEHLDCTELLLPGERILIEVPADIRKTFEKQWARDQLPEEFSQVAGQLPFSWTNLYIRSQKTKWGTCSSRGNISLNWRLIKCPDFIRRYIMIHELCHTVYMNHSKAYWSLVAAHYPEVKKAHDWLKKEGELAFL